MAEADQLGDRDENWGERLGVGERGIMKGWWGEFWGDVCIHNLGCDDGFEGVSLCQTCQTVYFIFAQFTVY